VDPQLQCPHCGYQLSFFRQNGKLGCTKCYESFKAVLDPLVSSIHGNVRHQDDLPPPETTAAQGEPFTQKPEIAALRAKINEAIAQEEYEEAARLRDQIKNMENH